MTLGRIGGDLYASVGLERADSTMAFPIDGPREATYAGLVAAPGDDVPETFAFAPAPDALGSAPVLFAANEESGNSRAFALEGGGEAAWHWHL